MQSFDQPVRTPAGEFLRQAHADLPPRGLVAGEARPNAVRRRLFRPTTPEPGESLRSLLARACERNYVPNSWGVLKYLGLANRNRVLVAEDPNLDPGDLAYAIRTSEDEILARRYHSLGSEHVSFFGLDVHRSLIETRVRRFSPVSLSDHPFHRAVWELREVPFCPFAWDILQDRCHCENVNGVVQGWTRTLSPVDCCDRCGEPLSDIEAISVPGWMREDLSLMLTLAGSSEGERCLGHELPDALARAERSQLFDVVRRMTNALAETPEYDENDPESGLARCEAMHAACRAIIEWPTGIYSLSPAEHFSSAAWARLLNSYLACGSQGQTAIAHGNARAATRENKVLEASRSSVDPIELLGMRPAAEASGIKDDVLTAFWEDRAFTQHRRAHGGRMLPAIERNELVEFACRWQDRVEIESFAYQLGITFHGVEQLIALDLLPATAPALHEGSPNLTSSEAAEFLRQITSGAADSVEDPILLRTAAHAIGGRLKPWGQIFAAMLTGDLSYVVSEDGRTLLDRISIEEHDMERLRTFEFDCARHPEFRFAGRMVQNDALATLNASRKSADVLKGLKSRGTNPKTYSVSDVEHLAMEVMTVPEIAFAMRLDSASVYNRLKRVGLQPAVAGAYIRSVVEPLIDVIADLGAPGRNPATSSRLFEQALMESRGR